MLLFFVSAGNKHFDVQFRRIRSIHFPSNDGKDVVCKGTNGWNGVYFPPESAYFFGKYLSTFPYFVP